jgi:hypothetical protein
LDAADDLFSAPFDHWTKGENVTRVELPDDSMSGYGVQFPMEAEESLAQEMYYPVLNGEGYVLTFKAKGTSLTYSVGGVTKEVALTEEWTKYTEKIVATETSKEFVISAMGATICEIQLERGTIATAWGNSPWDNSSDRAYIQSVAYLAESMTKDAMVEGSTDVLGGLILTNHIKVGNYVDGEMKKETAGMNGTYNEDNDVAFWAGGTLEQAMNAINENGENESNFSVSHGGKVVMNEAVVRGKVYAEEGEFKGEINIDATNVDGRVTINDNGLTYYGTNSEGEEYVKAALGIGNECSGASGAFYAPNAMKVCSSAAVLAIGDDDHRAGVFNGDVSINGKLDVRIGEIFVNKIGDPRGNLEISVGEESNISIEQGTVRGLRTSARVVTSAGTASSPNVLTQYDYSILVKVSTTTTYLKLPDTPQNGQEYVIETIGADIALQSSKNNIYIHEENNSFHVNSYTITSRGVFRVKYYADARMWTLCYIDSY